ncbi:MAG: HAD-IIB family hydrolase [Lactobacillaceae bacterium]|jgi:Cof subfamily protein (haloacid dehalogenase superfamily)|nr:HAD-IIB family hydrolase [Lactobacillaceae bacterium]
MTDIKLFATDLDGTFLRDDKTFDRDLLKLVLKELHQKNKYFVASSGRSFNGINHVFEDFNRENQIAYVAQNGGLVMVDGKVIFESNLPSEYLKPLFEAIPKLSVLPDRVMFEGRTKTFSPSSVGIDFLRWSQKRDPHFELVENVDQITEPIQKISMGWSDSDQKLMTQELISITGIEGLRTTSSGYGTLDIINDGISKAVGLQKLGDYLDVHGDEMAAFGDGENDLEMLYYVNSPFVMPNAPEFIQKNFTEAQHALADNNQSGVLRTIDSLI